MGGFVLIAVGIVLAAFVGMAGHRNLAAGMDGVQCSSSTLLDVALSGTEPSPGEDYGFAGILGLLQRLDGLLDVLDEDSNFMRGLRRILTDTESLESSVKMLTGTLGLLEETLALPENMKPFNHICHLCTALDGSIVPMKNKIENSMAKALDSARAEVDKQLTGEGLVELRRDLNEAMEPLIESKDTLRDSIGSFSDGDVSEAIDGIVGLVGLLVLGIFAITIPILCCDGSAVCCAAFKPQTNRGTYSKAPSRCACCGWCLGWPLAFIALFMGGLLMVVMAPVSGICLIMMDVNKENLLDWGPALGMSDKSFEDTVNVLEECIGETGQGKLMDVIMVDDGDGKISLRQKLEDETRGKINEQFDKLTEKSNDQKDLTDQKEFKDLLGFLDTDVSMLTTFDPDRVKDFQSKPEFQQFFVTEPTLAKTAFSTSASCLDYTIDKDGPLKNVALEDPEIVGLKSLQAEFAKKGLSPVTSCKGGCDCDLMGGNAVLKVAANSIMKMKRDLRQSSKYRCDLFKGPGGFPCDPKDFKKTGERCVLKEGDDLKMETKKITCTYPEFVQYVKDFRKRIDVATKEVQEQSNKMLPTIGQNLKRHVNEELLDEMFLLVDGVNCRFIGDAYWGLVDALCHQAARGMSEMSTAFAVMGGFVLALVILMYITFRRVVDNINISKNAVQPGGSPHGNAVVPEPYAENF